MKDMKESKMLERDVMGYQEPSYDDKKVCGLCEYYSTKGICELFEEMNGAMSDKFMMDSKVGKKASCKAHTKGSPSIEGLRKKSAMMEEPTEDSKEESEEE